MGKTAAVLGASRHRHKFGNKSLRAHLEAGFEAFAVNPNSEEGEIEGARVLSRLAEVPGPVHRVTVYLPPAVTLELLEEISQAAPKEVWLNPGSHDRAVLTRARELGLPIREGCSIVDLGMSPSQFPH